MKTLKTGLAAASVVTTAIVAAQTMGEGKIFVGLNDARLVALDQRTGEVVWSVEAERWQNGFSITSAPLYYDGMVITGFSGGEMASRGKVNAFSARDGKLVRKTEATSESRRWVPH